VAFSPVYIFECIKSGRVYHSRNNSAEQEKRTFLATELKI